jgi:hypothetical protein
MIESLDLVIPLITLFFVVLVNAYLRHRRLLAIVPPGPKQLPLIGHAFSIPSQAPWKTYAAWGEELACRSFS